MTKTLYSISMMLLLIINYGCATNVVTQQKLPTEYTKQFNLKSCDVSYRPDINVSDKLKYLLNEKFTKKILEINKGVSNKIIYLTAEIDKVDIANKGATLLAGAFVGKNSLHGAITIYEFETNNPIGKYRVEADRNYGGYSVFLDLEDKITEEFATQALNLLSSKEGGVK